MDQVVRNAPFARRRFEIGVSTLVLPGQAESGDMHLVMELPSETIFVVIDGLGHGHEAAVAAGMAIEIARENASESIISLLQRCHQGLKQTRGAVMSVVRINHDEMTLRWGGVGNVEGILIRSKLETQRPECLLLRAGVLGYQTPPPTVADLHVSQGDTIFLYTDGIRNGFVEKLPPADSCQQLAEAICTKFAKKNDDALILVARYL